MNFNTTLPINENMEPRPLTQLKSRTRSLVSRSNTAASTNVINNQKNGGLSVMDKIKNMFSSRNGGAVNGSSNGAENVSKKINKNINIQNSRDKTKLQGIVNGTRNGKYLQDEHNMSQPSTTPLKGNYSNVEWQPVYHETCKIKLPVEPNSARIAIPQESLEEWANDQAQLSQRAADIIATAESNDKLSKESVDVKGLQMNCLTKENISSSSCTNTSNKEEPYSKFKYYYNYYLVDDYLDSLAQSQNKKIDATGLNEEGELYENVSLNVKPILKTKERLESGVPYDPKVVIN